MYRKQYLTPTMIHRLVKTTPKPRATKKSKGELPLGLLLLDEVVVAGGVLAVVVGSGMVVLDAVVEALVAGEVAAVAAEVASDVACLATRAAPSSRLSMIGIVSTAGCVYVEGEDKVEDKG